VGEKMRDVLEQKDLRAIVAELPDDVEEGLASIIIEAHL